MFSLIASKQAEGLFHKAISMSGYTTSISLKEAYKPEQKSATSEYSSFNIVNKILDSNGQLTQDKTYDNQEIRDILLNLSTFEFIQHYSDRKSYEEIPLLTADGIIIPKIGLSNALNNSKLVNNVPTIAGSNRDEVKLWLGTAEYFVELDYSYFGSIFGIPTVVLKNDEAFEAFNYYRSSAWKIRGVDIPLNSLLKPVIMTYIHTDMTGMIIESILLLTLKKLLEQLMQLRFLYWQVIQNLLEVIHCLICSTQQANLNFIYQEI